MMIVVLVVALFAMVQSVFGMGLLVFGTPTLLLMDYPFNEVLSVLLPPSMTISLIQFLSQEEKNKEFIISLFKFCLPILIVSLAWTLMSQNSFSVNYIIACILLFTAASRFYGKLSNSLKRFIESNDRKYLVIMGLVHGMTNMGGSLLSAYAVTRYDSKKHVLACVVTAYLMFGFVQLATLEFSGSLNVGLNTLLNCLVAGAVYGSIGGKIYGWINEKLYQKVFTLFMLIYALLLILH